MKVSELINKLSKCQPDAVVLLWGTQNLEDPFQNAHEIDIITCIRVDYEKMSEYYSKRALEEEAIPYSEDEVTEVQGVVIG